MATATPRINIEVTADDQTDSELVARLITASLGTHGFEDVTNVASPLQNDKEEEVVEAMKALNPGLFTAEVTIESSIFEATDVPTADDQPGDEFPEQGASDDDEVLGEDE